MLFLVRAFSGRCFSEDPTVAMRGAEAPQDPVSGPVPTTRTCSRRYELPRGAVALMMGTFRVRVQVFSLADPRDHPDLEMLVDTGATQSIVPRSLMEALAVPV